MDSLHLGKLHFRRVMSTRACVIPWHTSCRFVSLPRAVPVILYEGSLHRPLSPIVTLGFFGRGCAEILPTFRQVTIPLVTFMPSRYEVAAPVKQPMTSRFPAVPCTGMLQRSFGNTPALSELSRFQGVGLTGGLLHPSLPTVGIACLLIF